jgi:predicted lipid-binding transport protein (Tim44 family)
MTMMKRNRTLKRAGPFAAGVLIGLSMVTPVFAATLDMETVQPMLLLGSLIVLLIGLILKAMSERPSTPANAQDSHALDPGDLRWSQTDLAASDIALPAHSMR